jgi:hypothetical protein
VYNLACLHSINPDWSAYQQLISSAKKEEPRAASKQKPADSASAKYGCIKKGVM